MLEMSELLYTDFETLRFGKLAQLSKALLVLPHSNADPERLFSMVRKIYTELRRHMDPTTLSDSLSVKLNNDNPCYLNETLMSENFIETAKKIHAQAYKLMHKPQNIFPMNQCNNNVVL